MRKLNWNHWTIATRLQLIVILPLLYLFVLVLTYTYYSRLNEIQTSLKERGNSTALALAEGVEYHLLNNKVSDIKQMLNGIVQANEDIYRIEVLDAKKKVLVTLSSHRKLQEQKSLEFELPIKQHLIWVRPITQQSSPPSVSQQSQTNSQEIQFQPAVAEVVGYVNVMMSDTLKMRKHQQRFWVELALAAFALLISTLMAWYLAGGLTRPLKIAIEALRDIRQGKTGTNFPISTGGEIGELQSSINTMSQSLHAAKQDLENKVLVRTQELIESRNQALIANAEKRKLLQKLHSIVENERRSIAIEIHDELNASLIAARLDAERIARLMEQALQTTLVKDDNSAEMIALRTYAQEVVERAKAMRALMLGLYASGRNLVRRLRPEMLEMLGLQGALEELLKQFQGSDCEFDLHIHGDLSSLHEDVALSAFRIIQEAISNVLKHAHAKQVQIKLILDKESQHLSMHIQDDGLGFDPQVKLRDKNAGIGLSGMRERVEALQGEFTLNAQEGSGTRIAISIPITHFNSNNQ
jgi:two-component system sensor histidine kinase UhpB